MVAPPALEAADAVAVPPKWPAFPIVGIGASAGGLESLERFFTHMPRSSGMAFVVVQHLSPDFKSVIDELLARRTRIPILQAEDGVQVEPDTVYLLPPRKEIVLKGGRLLLSDKDPKQGLSLPIDHFFRSLARDAGPMGAAVILSGTGTDGSRGLLEVKRMGGLVIAESETSAKFDGMPLAAQNTGVVDHVLWPEEMADVLCQRSREGNAAWAPFISPEHRETEPARDAIFRLLRDDCGIDFSHYKTSTVGRRIERRLMLHKLENLDQYVDRLRRDPRELSDLYEDLLIGVTRFFRDKEAFDALEHLVIPEMLAGVAAEDHVRVWVPGCATGEEAYSIAILLHEKLTSMDRPINVKLFATDVHRRSLEVAGTGLYGESSLADVNPERLRRYFVRRPNGYQVSQDLRELIVFAPHNVLRDAPFTRLDLITCRNLLIYFQPHAQRAALSLFNFGLKSGGVLFLGSSESPGPLSDDYDAINEHWRIYRKVRESRTASDMKLPLLRGFATSAGRVLQPAARATPADASLLASYDRLLDRFMPPGFLVDDDGQLLDTFGGAERYLKVKGRRPSVGFVDMLPEAARAPVAGALDRSRHGEGPVRYSGLEISMDGEPRCVDIVVERLDNPRTGARQLLVLLASEKPAAAGEHPEPPQVHELPHGTLTAERVRALEAELSYSRESLQTSVEELEASNEELQATNEELVASNEELQSTNEELHSVNEELYTVNAEYQRKILELEELNADFKHLLDGTDVGMLFLDADLRVRKFTPKIASIFRVQPRDVGRKLSDFTHALDRKDLIADVQNALDSGAVVETDVHDETGKCFYMRVLPYMAGGEPSAQKERSHHGVVLTFTDISALEQARAKVGQLSAIVESSEDAIVGKSLDGTITSWNGSAERLYGYSAAEACGKSAFFYVPEDRRDEESHFLQKLARGERVDHVETERLHKDGRRIPVSVTMSPIRGFRGAVVGISAIGRDITQLVAARREIREREEHNRLLLESMAEGVYGVDLNGACTFANPACARILGYDSAEQLVGKPMHAHHAPPEGTKEGADACPLEAGARSGQEVHADDRLFVTRDGKNLPVEYWSHPVAVGGKVVGAVVTFIDIAERKLAEQQLVIAARRREEFLAMLSHELRNPLAAVLNATNLMSKPTAKPQMIERARTVVARQAAHMARLLDDLLDVARIMRGAVGLRSRRCDFRECARAAVEALHPLLSAHRTDLKLELPDEPLYVDGDPDRLQQIVANLLGNAASYSPDCATVRLTLAAEGEQIVLRIVDHGIGIDPELLPHIFELFVQAEQKLDRPKGGLGIGLTLVKTLVELHGGTVEAHSEGAGKGSAFIVRLPASSVPVSVHPESRPVQARARNIVLVEDHDDSRELLKALLETKGYSVAEAADGHAALEAIRARTPDVALVDIGLPGMDGYELARIIRQDPALKDVVLVALTGYGRDADVRRAKETGFNHHLTKPVRPDVLDGLLSTL